MVFTNYSSLTMTTQRKTLGFAQFTVPKVTGNLHNQRVFAHNRSNSGLRFRLSAGFCKGFQNLGGSVRIIQM
jgi:hypothetical protein